MKCPNCGLEQPDAASECGGCQIIFSKWAAKQAKASPQAAAAGAAVPAAAARQDSGGSSLSKRAAIVGGVGFLMMMGGCGLNIMDKMMGAAMKASAPAPAKATHFTLPNISHATRIGFGPDQVPNLLAQPAKGQQPWTPEFIQEVMRPVFQYGYYSTTRQYVVLRVESGLPPRFDTEPLKRAAAVALLNQKDGYSPTTAELRTVDGMSALQVVGTDGETQKWVQRTLIPMDGGRSFVVTCMDFTDSTLCDLILRDLKFLKVKEDPRKGTGPLATIATVVWCLGFLMLMAGLSLSALTHSFAKKRRA